MDWDEVRSILSLYHLEGLEDFGPLGAGPDHTTYWVRADGQRYVLRVAARKRFSDMVFEKDLIRHLAEADLEVPDVLENVASGAFTPWEVRGRYVTLFEEPGGRSPGRFEVRPKHCDAVGEFLGRMHAATETFHGHRANPFDLVELAKQTERLVRALDKKRLPRRYAADVERLAAEVERQQRRESSGPRGVIHGGLSIDVTRFYKTGLLAVTDFERACRERLGLDVGIAIAAWCWEPAAEQQGGPAGRFVRPRVRALVAGYQRIRRMWPDHVRELEDDVKLACTRTAVARLAAYELRKSGPEQGYRDYRHYTARLAALLDPKAEPLIPSKY
jgi:Ser/Thr protein kinase RdoA (MazF antagonist)